MKKQHGPAFKVDQVDLAQCLACKGRAVVKGVFHDLACIQCNASGWVTADTGEVLPLDVLVTQLSIRLQAADHQLAQFRKLEVCGAGRQYEQNNRRGAGGTNYTGD
ncbi:hypothetical protein [Pseudomonas prosekii]|nr:hypothetical protein [Pseudomonas prosekii]